MATTIQTYCVVYYAVFSLVIILCLSAVDCFKDVLVYNISLFPPIRRVHIQKNIYTMQIQWSIIDKMSMQLILMLL